MNLFKLIVDIGLNSSGYELGIKRVEAATEKLSDHIEEKLKDKLAEAFGVAALEEFARRTIENAEHILDLSQRVDVSTKSIQEWGYAAKKSGSDLDEAAKFLENLAASREKALGGDSGSLEMFSKLGIRAKDLALSVDDIGRKIGKAFQSGNTQELIGALKEVGGRGSTGLIPAFKDGLDELSAAANKAGKVLDTEVLVRLKMIGEEIKNAFAPGAAGASIIVAFSKRLQDAFSVIKIGAGGLAAFIGALSGGATFKDALKAYEDVFDEQMKEREDREKEVQKRVEVTDTAGKNAATELGKLIDFTPLKNKQSGSESFKPSATPWQQLGAAVRYNPSEIVLKGIEYNTRQTAANTAKQTAAGGNFGAAF